MGCQHYHLHDEDVKCGLKESHRPSDCSISESSCSLAKGLCVVRKMTSPAGLITLITLITLVHGLKFIALIALIVLIAPNQPDGIELPTSTVVMR